MGAVLENDYYQLLGVDRGASKEQIRNAYKELARVFHPDSHFYDEILESAGIKPEVEDNPVFKAITEAYNVLSNEDKRAEYDRITPSNLPGWDEDSKAHWYGAYRADEQSANGFNPERVRADAAENFGAAVERVRNRAPRSALDDENMNSVRSVSEMIAVRRTFWGRILHVLGLS